jgi:hypothetical protein
MGSELGANALTIRSTDAATTGVLRLQRGSYEAMLKFFFVADRWRDPMAKMVQEKSSESGGDWGAKHEGTTNPRRAALLLGAFSRHCARSIPIATSR